MKTGLKGVQHTRWWRCFELTPELWRHRDLSERVSLRGTGEVSLEFREGEMALLMGEM